MDAGFPAQIGANFGKYARMGSKQYVRLTDYRGGDKQVNHVLMNILAQAAADNDQTVHAMKLIGAGLAMGLGGIGPGIGLGLGTLGAVQAIGRNPDAEGPVRTMAILGLGFAEAVAIYALVVSLVIIFVA